VNSPSGDHPSHPVGETVEGSFQADAVQFAFEIARGNTPAFETAAQKP
jgi:hypothetical protein